MYLSEPEPEIKLIDLKKEDISPVDSEGPTGPSLFAPSWITILSEDEFVHQLGSYLEKVYLDGNYVLWSKFGYYHHG